LGGAALTLLQTAIIYHQGANNEEWRQNNKSYINVIQTARFAPSIKNNELRAKTAFEYWECVE
jgi:hypothetical protein